MSEPIRVLLADDHTLEVEITREQNLNDVFVALSNAGIQVMSMRNKSNRLEELFLDMVERGNLASKNTDKKAS